MNQRFTLDRKSFEEFLAAASLIQQLKKQAAPHGSKEPGRALLSLLQLQRAIHAGTVDVDAVMTAVLSLAEATVGATSAGIWMFRDQSAFSCRAHTGPISDPQRLGADLLCHLSAADSDFISPTKVWTKSSRYPGYPNSMAMAALRVNGRVVGALAAFSTQFNAFSEKDLENLRVLAGLLQEALQQAMRAGYRDAVALEKSAMLNLLRTVQPQFKELQKHLELQQDAGPARFVEETASAEITAEEEHPAPALSDHEEPTEPSDEVRNIDVSLPGVGVRAALGDVREYSGETEPLFLWTALRAAAAETLAIAGSCRSKIQTRSRASLLKLRALITRAARVPAKARQYRPWLPSIHRKGRETATGTAPELGIVSQERPSWLNNLSNRKIKVRLTGFSGLRDGALLATARARISSYATALSRSLARLADAHLGTGQEWISQKIRAGSMRARAARREWRQKSADVYAILAQQRMKMRVASRRHKQVITSSAEATGEALQHAGESFSRAAGVAGKSTIAAIGNAKAELSRVRAPKVNAHGLRQSAGAIAVLGIMAVFVGLQASVHAPYQSNAVTAAENSAAAKPSHQDTKPASDSVEESTTHLKITDASVADNLHELTRYEIATLQRAADYGDDDAAFQLGMAYETGYYVRQNCSKAAHWVKAAAEAGNPAAQYNLGLRYRSGDGLTADESAASHWLRVATAQRYSPGKLAMATTH